MNTKFIKNTQSLLDLLENQIPKAYEGIYTYNCCGRTFIPEDNNTFPDKNTVCNLCIDEVSFLDGNNKQKVFVKDGSSWIDKYNTHSWGAYRKEFRTGKELLQYIKTGRMDTWLAIYQNSMSECSCVTMEEVTECIKNTRLQNTITTKNHKIIVKLFNLANIWHDILKSSYTKTYSTGITWSETATYNTIHNIIDILTININSMQNYKSCPWRNNTNYDMQGNLVSIGDNEIQYLSENDLLEEFIAVQTVLNIQFREDTARTLNAIVNHMRNAGTELML